MKTDARVRYTVHMIQNVFLELLKEKPVAKITVKEICEHAEINRSTFYKQVYVLNDFSFSSIASENTKEEKKEILIKGLEIVKKSMK